MSRRSRVRAHDVIAFASTTVQRYGGLLQQPLARRFLVAQFLSSIGDWFNFVAVIVVANRLGLGHGELAVGTALALRFVPRLLFQGPAGALTDRVRGPGLLIASQVVMSLLAFAMISLRWFPHLWLLYTLLFLLEATYTVSRPAFMVLLIRIIPPEQRGSANGIISLGLTAAQFIGAAIGGLIYAWTTESLLFLVNAGTFLLLAFLIWQIRDRIPDRIATFGVEQPEEPLASYRDLTRQPSLMLYLAQQATVVILIQAATALFVTRALELGRPDSASGLFLSMVGLGLIIGSVAGGAGRYVTPAALIVVAATEMIGGLGLVLFGVTDAWAVALAALVLTGLASQISDVAGTTYFQNALPDAIYGRFFSLFLLALSIGGLAGSLLGPLLQRALSTGSVLAVLFIPAIVTSIPLAWKNRSAVASERRATADLEALS